jgi:hypothetical protein
VNIEMASALLAPLPSKKKLDLLSKNAKSALLSWHKSSTKDKKTAMWLEREKFLTSLFGEC